MGRTRLYDVVEWVESRDQPTTVRDVARKFSMGENAARNALTRGAEHCGWAVLKVGQVTMYAPGGIGGEAESDLDKPVQIVGQDWVSPKHPPGPRSVFELAA